MGKKITITEKQYENLNNYYNDLCLGLSINDGFFLNNIQSLGFVSFNVSNILEHVNLKQKIIKDNLSFLEIFDKSKEIIKQIEPKYLEDFNKIMSKGILEVNYDILDIPFEERNMGCSCFTSDLNNDKEKGIIKIDDSFNYNTIPSLIHEFFHKTNESKNKARYLLSEYISVYFEIYTYELLKKQGISLNQLNLNYRLFALKDCCEFIEDKGFYLYTFDQLGNYKEDTYKYINYSNIPENILKEELLLELNWFEQMEEIYNNNKKIKDSFSESKYYIMNQYSNDYRYLLGALLAYYSLYNLTKDDVLKLNEALINNKEITFEEALKIINITIDDNTINKCIESIKRYACENDLIKKEEDTIKK